MSFSTEYDIAPLDRNDQVWLSFEFSCIQCWNKFVPVLTTNYVLTTSDSDNDEDEL